MEIERNGVKIKLTKDEIYKAHIEFVTGWMKSEIESMEFPESVANELAVTAYELYSEGNGETEYECIEKAADDFRRKIKKELESKIFAAKISTGITTLDVKEVINKRNSLSVEDAISEVAKEIIDFAKDE